MLYRSKAFTLAELLIALAILGVIATFAIPKILAGQQIAKRESVFKEAIAALSQLSYTAALKYPGDANAQDGYIRDNINVLKLCNPANTCWTMAQPATATAILLPTSSKAGRIANGAVIEGLDYTLLASGIYYSIFALDWNGTDLPNTEGQDQLMIIACKVNSTSPANCKQGQFVAASVTSQPLFDAIFQ